MTRTPRWTLMLATAAALVAACRGPSRTPSESMTPATAEELQPVHAHIQQLVDEGTVPSMTVAVAQDGEVIWAEGFGLADVAHSLRATPNTPYPLASISKPLTATGLMILVERGLIELDAPINDYLGEAQVEARVGSATDATIRRIADHTAGLPIHSQHYYVGEDPGPPPFETTVQRYGQLITPPGERWQYSNLGYGLLGHVIETASGRNCVGDRDYAGFMRDEVFIPLGMTRTAVYTDATLRLGTAAKYTSDGTSVPPYLSDSPAATQVYGSALDLVRFGMFHLQAALPDQEPIIGEASIDAMHTPGSGTGPIHDWEELGSGYGLGWHVSLFDTGLRVIHHSGGTLGVSTVIALVPQEQLIVVVLSNTDSQWPDSILIETMCALLDLDPGVFLQPGDGRNDTGLATLPDALVGRWEGRIETSVGEVALTMEVGATGDIHTILGDQPRARLQAVSYQDRSPGMLNASGGPYLRGLLKGELRTPDIDRGLPAVLWLELKHRGNTLTGSLTAFSQRDLPTGPLAHWVALTKTAAP